MLKKAKAAFLLILALVFALQGVGMESAQAAVSTVNGVTIDDSVTLAMLQAGLGDSAYYGVIAEEYATNNHSEASIFVDKLNKNTADAIFASGYAASHMSAEGIKVELVLPEVHMGDTLTFGLFTKSGENYVPTRYTTNVDVSNKSIVTIDFGEVDDYTTSQDLYVFQLEDDKIVGEKNSDGLIVGGKNSDGMEVEYGPAIKSGNMLSSYIGDYITTEGNSAYLFQQENSEFQGPYHGLELGEGVRLYYQDDQSSTGYTMIPQSSQTGAGAAKATDTVYIYDESWGTTDGKYNAKRLDSVCYDGEDIWLYRLANKKYKLNLEYYNTSNKAATLLAQNAALSQTLATSGLGLGGQLIGNIGDDPVETGNSTTRGAVTGGAVISLYGIELTADGKLDNSDLIQIAPGSDVTSFQPDHEGFPIAANEYIVMNVEVPAGVDTVNMTGVNLGLRNADGTVDNPAEWRNRAAQSHSRLIWNYVNPDGTPYEGEIYVGSFHGGMVLAPKAKITVTAVANSVTLVGKSVDQQGVEIHQNSFGGSRTYVRMINNPTVTVKGTKTWDDEGNSGRRPASIEIKLYANNVLKNTYTVTPVNGVWSWEITGLPKEQNGVAIQYRVEEKPISYYVSDVQDTPTVSDDGSVFTQNITNTFDSKLIAINGKKVWNDANDQDDLRPESVTVTLQSRRRFREMRYDRDKQQWVSDASKRWTEYTGWADHSVNMGIMGDYDDTRVVSAETNWEFDFGQLPTLVVGSGFDWKYYEYQWQYRVVETKFDGNNVTVDGNGNVKYFYGNRDTGYDVTYSNDGTGKVGNIGDPIVITNRHTPSKINIKVSKQWIENGDTETTNTLVNIGIYRSVEGGRREEVQISPSQLTKDMGWTATYKNLDAYDPQGKPYTYEVVEKQVPDGYWDEYVVREDQNGNITARIVNIRKTVRLKGEKVWEEPRQNDQPNNDQLRVNIMRVVNDNDQENPNDSLKDTLVTTIKLTEFEGGITLPEVDAYGNKAEYYPVEVPIPGYESSVELTSSGVDSTTNMMTYQYKITNKLITISMTVTKEWDDLNNAFNTRPDSNKKIKFVVERRVKKGTNGTWSRFQANGYTINGQPGYGDVMAELAVSQTDKTQTVVFGNLPVAGANGEWEYRVIEENRFAEYSNKTGEVVPDKDGNLSVTITNALNYEGKISGEKKWVGDTEAERPDSVTINLVRKADNEVVKTTTATKANNWKWEFTGLPKDPRELKKFLEEYTVDEVAVEGYTSAVTKLEGPGNDNKFEITNTKESATGTTSISVTKVWNPAAPTGTGEDDLTNKLTLYKQTATGEEALVDKPTRGTTDATKHTYTWTGLDEYDDNNAPITYYVKETPIDGYNTSYSSGAYALDKGTITNTEIGAASGSFTIGKSFTALANADKKSEDVNLPVSFQFDVVRVMSDGKEEVVSGSPFTVPAEWKGSVSTPTTVNVAFPAKGTYTYKVTENTTGAVAGVIYDESCFTVEFVVTEVTESGVKKLQVTGPAIKKFANSADTIGEAADSVSFCNYYGEVEVNLTATKKVQTASGAAVELKDDQFSLKLVDDKNNAEIKSVPANGTVTFDALKYTYADLEQEEPDENGRLVKKFTYTVSEVIPEKEEDRLPGYTYDTNTYPVEVTLTYTPGTNGAAPSLTASAEYKTADGKAPVFTNTYAATGEVELKVKKILSGRPFAEGDSFTFTLSAKEGQTNVPMPSVTEVTIDPSKNADAMASFGLINYTEADAGKEYVYIITEKAGDLENVSYDTVGHEVTVKVEDKGDGTMTATPSYAPEKDALEITNTYFAAGEFTLDVEKQMIGRSFQQGDSFTIAVTGSEGAPMPEKTSVTITPDTGNTAKVDFGKISYDELDVGQTYTYTYTVKEQPGTQNGVTYDLADHTVTVQVTKAADGTLSITPTYEDGEKVIIKNTYEANGKMELAVTKELKGREAVETDAFTFLLTGSDGAPMPESAVNGVAELTLNLSKETTGTFAPIAFKQEDEGKTYTYTVTEKKPAEGEDSKGIQYSGESYTITAVIADNGLGIMEATKTIVNSKGEKVDAITFANTYAATGALDLEGRKTLTGRTLKDGEFTFAVEKADGTPVSTATHKADGTIEFQPIQYTLDDLGDHTYIIYEKVPATTDAAYDAKVKYDENKHTVTVTVADETKDGKLEVTVKAGDPKVLNFTNTYGTSAAVQFKATKELDKATLTAEQFSFQLIGEADSVLQTKNNAADGSVTFDSLSYTLEDMKGDDGSIAVSRQISYTIREVLPEGVTAETPTKDNITYDTTEHKVTVDLAYNAETGELMATAQYNTADGKAPVFTNTYTEATTMLMVTKVWAGDSEADRPDEITLNLAYRAAGSDDEWTNYPVDWDDSGAIAKATIVQDDGSWDIYIDGLPKRMDGKEVEWSATETVPAGYAAAYTDADGKAAERAENGATITNTYEAETYSLVLEKTDKLDPSKKLPDAVYTVYTDEACDEAHKYAEITTGEDGTGTLTDVPAGTYWVKESKAPDGYQVDPKAYPVTVPNAEDPTKPAEVKVADYPKTSVSVTKVWVGAPDGVTLPEITVQLLADGEVVTGKTLTLNAANNWNGKFTELDSHDATTGKAIAYTVKEKKVNGYTSQITGDAATGYTITNTYESKVSVQLKATKILEGAELQAEQFAFVMRLANGIVWDVQWNKADGSITFADVTYKKAGVYTFTIMEEIPDEKEEGYTYDETVHTVVVTVVEDPITKQLSVTVDYGDTGEVVFTNTYAEATTMLMVTKVWAGDSEADRPDEITLNLAYRAAGTDDEWTNYPVDWDDSGAIAKATIVQDDGSWDIYIDGLPKHMDGKEVEWSATETVPAGYAAAYTDADGKAAERAENGATITNTYEAEEKLGKLMLSKSDRLNPSKKLSGAEYTVFTQETCKDEEILILPNGTKAIITTGEDGWGTLTGVPAGTYWVKETKAPVGYEVDPLPYKVVVEADAEEPVQVEVTDFPLRGALSLSKTVVGTNETEESFLFDIVLNNAKGDPIVGSYEATLNGTETKAVAFVADGENAKATVALKDGETLVIHGLRAGTTYTVSEQPNAIYDVEINGVPATSAVGTISDTALSVAKFQNTLKLTSFAVKKEWTGLADGETAPAITLTLYCNGTIYPVATPAPDQNGWYTYTNLPSVVNGKAAVYTVKEEPVTGFTTTYLNKGEHADATDCAYNGGTIVNSKIPQTGDTTPLALWMLTTLLAACGLAGVTVAARKREN